MRDRKTLWGIYTNTTLDTEKREIVPMETFLDIREIALEILTELRNIHDDFHKARKQED